MTPMDAFNDWFDSLSEAMKLEVIVLMFYLIPGSPIDVNTADKDRLSAVRGWLGQTEPDARKLGAKALILRDMVSFFVIPLFGTPQVWQEQRRIVQKQLNDAQVRNASSVPNFQQLLQNLPARESEWLQKVAEWNTLCNGVLSDAEIRMWIDNNSQLKPPAAIVAGI